MWTECDSVRAVARLCQRTPPRVVLMRHRLSDGYSDDAIAALTANKSAPMAKIIVLLPAGTPISTEVRQISLGADYVQRDPVRTDVLAAYIAKYLKPSPRTAAHSRQPSSARMLSLGGATLDPLEQTLHYRGKTISITPRETLLAELLSRHAGKVVTYETLYSEILGRQFQGDTSNMRVLLGKLNASALSLGIALRGHIEVIPKTGYSYKYR